MSKPWNPDEELDRLLRAERRAARRKGAWPEGATTGLVLVAGACLGAIALLYRIAGPRDVFTP